MKLILITQPAFFTEEDRIITALFEEGLDYLHLRKPDSDPLYSERLLSLIPERFHQRIITHDHFYLKDEFDLAGVHLNHRNPSLPQNYKGRVSCSCHSLQEVKLRKDRCDYLFLSPVFDSISKKGYCSGFSQAELTEAAHNGLIDQKVIALGGIHIDRITFIKEMGFGGAAILGDIWERFNPLIQKDYQDLIRHFKQMKRLAD